MTAGKSAETVKQTIIHYVRKAVRELQKEYVANRDVIPSSELTNSLCYGLEAVFLHGLVGSLPDKMASTSFWSILSKYIHKSSLMDIDSLSQIKTDIGRCRVWIRLALNGCEFDSYLRLILANNDTLRQFYESWAFIRDHECTDLLLSSIQGLECVNFHLGHNSTVLNEWSSTSLSLVGGSLVTEPGTTNPELDLSATSSFDDYELSPDDREEVRLMFRFENVQNSSSDHRSEAAINESDEAKSESQNFQESKETASLNKEDIVDAKLSQNAETGVQAVGGDDHRTAKSRAATPPKIRMTDEMRDCRFDRIVRENLERYPLDYDRDYQQKLTEAAEARTQSHDRRCATETAQKHPKTPPIPSSVEFSSNEISGGEPDEFWKTLNDDDGWIGTEAGSAGTPSPVQGNSLPRDSWVGPLPSASDGPTCGFSAEANDRISNELEASYGTILSDYQKANPQQFKMVTQEGAVRHINDSTGGTSAKNMNKSLKDSPKRVSENQKLSVIDEEWVVIEDDCPFISEPYHVDSSCKHLLSYVTQRFVKRTTDDQNQKCHGCSREIEGKSRACSFDGHSYCTQCHRNDLFLVPSQIIFNWDFQKHKVAVESFQFLKKIYDWPLVNIQELNPELYSSSVELSLIRELRQQSYHLAGYMFHCTSTYAAKYWCVMNARLYYFSHTDNYSLQDLVNVESGSFRKVLKKINDSTIEHVYECEFCRAKGFYCEICQSADIIFPFQTKTTTVCDCCKNTYHRKCKSSREVACPKCIRLELRKTTSSDPIDRVMFTHPKDILSTNL